jgi:uncharacterized coiled-coil DUF342 family protein
MDIDTIAKECAEIKNSCTRIETKIEFFKKDIDVAHEKIREVDERVERLEEQITLFRGQIKGAYFVFGIGVSALLAILIKTGVIARIFGG